MSGGRRRSAGGTVCAAFPQPQSVTLWAREAIALGHALACAELSWMMIWGREGVPKVRA